MNEKQALIVLGMHRSGTSVAMALAEMQGVHLGSRLFGARDDNPKGFFEHADVIDLNEKIFNAFGLHSQDVVPLPEAFENRPEIQSLLRELLMVLKRDFAQTPTFGLKDPRMCLLMPVWHVLLEEFGAKPTFLIPYRHPLEVAASLTARDKISQQHGLLLWLRYTLEIIAETKNHPRYFVAFDDLLAAPQQHFENVSKYTGFQFPKPFPQQDAALFISKELRHQKAQALDESGVLPWVMEVYRLLPKIAEDKTAEARALEIRRELRLILAPAAEMAYAKGRAEQTLREELAKKRKWLPWAS